MDIGNYGTSSFRGREDKSIEKDKRNEPGEPVFQAEVSAIEKCAQFAKCNFKMQLSNLKNATWILGTKIERSVYSQIAIKFICSCVQKIEYGGRLPENAQCELGKHSKVSLRWIHSAKTGIESADELARFLTLISVSNPSVGPHANFKTFKYALPEKEFPLSLSLKSV